MGNTSSRWPLTVAWRGGSPSGGRRPPVHTPASPAVSCVLGRPAALVNRRSGRALRIPSILSHEIDIRRPESLVTSGAPLVRRRRLATSSRGCRGEGRRWARLSLDASPSPRACARVPQVGPPGQESGRRQLAGAGSLAGMPIEPPDPGFIGNILRYILTALAFGGVLLPKALQRRRLPHKRS